MTHLFLETTHFLLSLRVIINLEIPLIGKDGDDVIDNITCEIR